MASYEEGKREGFDAGADHAMESFSNALTNVVCRYPNDTRTPHVRLWDSIDAERTRVRREAIDAACKAECRSCEKGIPVFRNRYGYWLHEGPLPRCDANEIRRAAAQMGVE